MRIATSQLYDRPTGAMTRLTAEADRIQQSIASGKRLAAPSDDAAAYLQLRSLARAAADDRAYAGAITTAQGVLAQSDATLETIESRLQRAQELATRAASETLSDANRSAIAGEVRAILDDLFALANSRDVRGQPLFGGATGTDAYARAADGTILWAGSGDPAAIPIADGVSVAASVTGQRAFASGSGDMFAVLEGFAAALETGDGAAAARDALTGIGGALESVGLARASVGARAARLELETERLAETAETREAARSALEDTDIAAAVADLQKTLTILQATQASFTKLTGMTLFDYLR